MRYKNERKKSCVRKHISYSRNLEFVEEYRSQQKVNISTSMQINKS